MTRMCPPAESDYQRAMREHEHFWDPVEDEPWIIEDGVAVFTFVCNWQPTKSILGEFETHEAPMGPPCEELIRVELECQGGEKRALIAEKNFVVGSYEVIECVPPDPNFEEPGGRLVIHVGGEYGIEVTFE